MIRILGNKLECVWLVYKKKKPIAYSLHYTREKAISRAEKIRKFHSLKAKIVENRELDKKLEKIIEKVLKGEKVLVDVSRYKYNQVYATLLKLQPGKTITYSELANITKLNIYQVIKALTYNPMLIIIPCHRVIRKDKTIGNYTPFGKDFKEKLLYYETKRVKTILS
ncbi:MAG TPA: methylated-DNA--[protein]-cysteine S-methyltransferase [Nanoarchaeota archaeon]|nr:methylated-DNA--[protein]-cysteine S-methyltransferase [Nanoarchaeota archaeon]